MPTRAAQTTIKSFGALLAKVWSGGDMGQASWKLRTCILAAFVVREEQDKVLQAKGNHLIALPYYRTPCKSRLMLADGT